jgi:hypothetical protein
MCVVLWVFTWRSPSRSDDDGRNTPDRSHGKRKSAGRRRAAEDDDDEFADAEAEFKIRIKLSRPGTL